MVLRVELKLCVMFYMIWVFFSKKQSSHFFEGTAQCSRNALQIS